MCKTGSGSVRAHLLVGYYENQDHVGLRKNQIKSILDRVWASVEEKGIYKTLNF